MSGLLEKRHLIRLLGYVDEARGYLVLTVLFGVVGFLVTFIYPYLIGELIDEVMLPANRPRNERVWRLVWLAAGGVLTPFLFAISGYGRGHFNMLMGNRIVIALRRDLFRHLQSLPLYFYSKERSGTIVNHLMHEVHAVSSLLHSGVILLVIDILQLVIAVTLLLRISPVLTAGVVTVLPGYVATFYFLNPRVRGAAARVQEFFAKFAGNVQEQLAGIALTKACGAQDHELARLTRESESYYRLLKHQSSAGHAVGAVSEFFIHMGSGITIGLAGYLTLYRDDPLTPGDLTRFIGYAGILYGPLRRISHLNILYQDVLSSIRRVMSFFDIKGQVVEAADPVQSSPTRGEVTFQNVSFSYEWSAEQSNLSLEERSAQVNPADPGMKERTTVLKNICISVRAGERVGLVGPSGSGKTTLVSLIPRLYDTTSGEVLVDGIDVRSYSLNALRSAIAVVQQETFLFSGTIRESLKYGTPDATDEEMFTCAKAANAHEFICMLPNGYSTEIGERGVRLSVGQRQRLAIGRALLRDPKILILDEATSALDAGSEALVVEALERLMQGRTCFIVAHRLSTIRGADHIFTLDRGEIIEDGHHEQLLSKRGLYAELFSKQFQIQPPKDPLRQMRRTG